MRAIRGYGNDQRSSWNRGWRTYHSIQLSFQRRFQNGVSFGFNDTIGLYDQQQAGARLQHNADGSYRCATIRRRPTSCWATTIRIAALMRANFVWDLPGPAERPAGM